MCYLLGEELDVFPIAFDLSGLKEPNKGLYACLGKVWHIFSSCISNKFIHDQWKIKSSSIIRWGLINIISNVFNYIDTGNSFGKTGIHGLREMCFSSLVFEAEM